jgi:hypothetical protein
MSHTTFITIEVVAEMLGLQDYIDSNYDAKSQTGYFRGYTEEHNSCLGKQYL